MDEWTHWIYKVSKLMFNNLKDEITYDFVFNKMEYSNGHESMWKEKKLHLKSDTRAFSSRSWIILIFIYVNQRFRFLNINLDSSYWVCWFGYQVYIYIISFIVDIYSNVIEKEFKNNTLIYTNAWEPLSPYPLYKHLITRHISI